MQEEWGFERADVEDLVNSFFEDFKEKIDKSEKKLAFFINLDKNPHEIALSRKNRDFFLSLVFLPWDFNLKNTVLERRRDFRDINVLRQCE